jgi:ferric-dicitrate binding protein FerR (iron transport regulator)
MKQMDQERDLRSEQALEELLSKAKPRPQPPVQDEVLIRQAVRAEWDQVTNRRIRTRRMIRFAFAASVLLAVFASLNALRGPFDGNQLHQVASIEKQFGTLTMLNDDQAVETGSDSGLTLAWNDGGSLRLDQNTRVEFKSGAEIYLHSGRIYFDSMPSGIPAVVTNPNKAKLTIRSEAGTVRHFGTQFIAELDGHGLNVLVREGHVMIDAPNGSETATAGQKLTVSSNGQTTVHDVEVTGGEWKWIEKTSPSFTLDNRPIMEFLTWVSRETGQPLRISGDIQQMINTKELRGVVDMEPSRALQTYMQTIAVEWHIEDGVIVIGGNDPNNRSGGT